MTDRPYEVYGDAQLTGTLRGPTEIVARDDAYEGSDYDIEMSFKFRPETGFELRELRFKAKDGQPGITTSGVRDSQIGGFELAMRAMAIGYEVKWSGGDLTDLGNAIKEIVRKRDRVGPTDDVLELVAVLVDYNMLVGTPPVKALESMFKIPNRTASRWIRLAKDRGFLQDGPTKITPGTPPSGQPVSMPTDQLDEYLSRPRTKEI